MLHKWMEEWYDTLLYLAVLMGTLIFFLCFWKDEIQNRYAEAIAVEFLTETAAKGKLTLREYEALVKGVTELDSDFEIRIRGISYELQPVYALIPKERLIEYYMRRNTKKDWTKPEKEMEVSEEKAEELQFQQESNETIMAAEQKEYLPLPEENVVEQVNAVRPFQEVYEGEELITLCRVQDATGVYYVEAEPLRATVSGMVYLSIESGDLSCQVPVEVLCHPRKIQCLKLHEVVNSKEIVQEYKRSGLVKCPYCAVIPEQIECNSAIFYLKTGMELADHIWITATYLDGHIETITPESEEWVDSYDKNFCGIQRVTICYRGIEEHITVISENDRCKQCGEVCNERCHDDYSRFPYCVDCMAAVPLFTGETYEEEKLISMEELWKKLDETGAVCMEEGSFLELQLSRGKYVSKMQRKILRTGK